MKKFVLALTACLMTSLAAWATDYTWDSTKTGAQAWATTSGFFSTTGAAPFNQAWSNATPNNAIFTALGSATTLTTSTTIIGDQLRLDTANLTLATASGGSFTFNQGIATAGGPRTVGLSVGAATGFTVTGTGNTTAGKLTVNLASAVDNRGLQINSGNALGTNSTLNVTGVAGAFGTLVRLGAGVATASGLSLDIVNGTPTSRTTLRATSGTTSWAGSISTSGGRTFIDTSNANLTISGNVSNATNLTLRGASGSGTVSGVISGSGTITKIEATTWTLTGNNTYTGTTTVSGGTLIVNGTNSGAITVNTSAGTSGTLGGTGTINGTTIVKLGGTVQAGDTVAPVGTLNVGSLTVQSGGSIGVRIANTSTTGTVNGGQSSILGASNLLAVASGRTLDVNSLSNFVIDGSGTAALTAGSTYSYIIASGGTINSVTITDAARFNFSGFSGAAIDTTSLSLQNSGNNLYLNFTAVPEPSLMLGLGAGVLALGAFLRKRFA